MTIAPEDLIAQAESLALDTEVDVRNATGRAYYAAYHLARIFHAGLKCPGEASSYGGEHENLIHRLQNPDKSLTINMARKSRQIGYLLYQIKPYRHKADYDLLIDMPAYEAALTIKIAQSIQNIE